MTEFPRSFPGDGFFFVNGVTSFQEGVGNKLRLAEEIKLFGSVHEEGNNIAFRFPVQNTVVFKGGIAKNGKPVGTPPPLIHQPLPVSL
jgi:hypothetical protein